MMKNKIFTTESQSHKVPGEKLKIKKGILYIFSSFFLCVSVSLWFNMILSFAQFDTETPDEELFLYVGEVKPCTIDHPTRVLISNPEILDVIVISDNQLLIKAKSAGAANLLIWEQDKSRTIRVDVVDVAKRDTVEELKSFLEFIDLADNLQIDKKGDIILLTGRVQTPDDFSRLEQILAKFPGVINLVNIQDIKPLVELNVEILELNTTYKKNLGVDWTDQVKLTEAKGTQKGIEALRVAGFGRDTTLVATISTLLSEGKGRVLSNPRLVTVSGKKATSFVGGQIPILTSVTTAQTTTTGGTSTTQGLSYRDYGINLEITPKVIEGTDKVNTELFIEVSSVDMSVAITVQGVPNPGFKSRNTRTEVLTDSGDTIIISGLIQSDESKVVDKVPGLADVPILGGLFKSTDFKKGETELVITITPRVLTKPSDEDVATKDTSESYFRYVKGIGNMIAASLRYPDDAKESEIEGDVRLSLLLQKDGTLKTVSVVNSSGYDILDEEAKNAATRLSPYPHFPQDLKENELWIDVPVIFKLD